jgi:hypothetical protein
MKLRVPLVFIAFGCLLLVLDSSENRADAGPFRGRRCTTVSEPVYEPFGQFAIQPIKLQKAVIDAVKVQGYLHDQPYEIPASGSNPNYTATVEATVTVDDPTSFSIYKVACHVYANATDAANAPVLLPDPLPAGYFELLLKPMSTTVYWHTAVPVKADPSPVNNNNNFLVVWAVAKSVEEFYHIRRNPAGGDANAQYGWRIRRP